MKNIKKFPNYLQLNQKDCGPTCIRIITKFYGLDVPLNRIRDLCETNRLGSNLENVARAAEEIGFRTLPVMISADELTRAHLPCILHWDKKHFLVLYKIKNGRYYVSDPEQGRIEYSEKEFLYHWISEMSDKSTEEGIALLVEPRPGLEWDSFADETGRNGIEKNIFGFLWQYAKSYRPQLWQLAFGLIGAILLQLVLPFLTQSLVDVGVKNHDISFVYLILFAQLFVFIGRMIIEALRSWILLYLSTRVNVSMVSDFFYKLMRLPISYFDTKLTGDIMQRIRDHKRIETLLTESFVEISFFLVTFLVFGGVLFFYSGTIFLVFMLSAMSYFAWILFFLKRRRQLDHKRFYFLGKENNKIIELVQGMRTVKLNNAERDKRWGWEAIQAKLFKVSIASLRLRQFQDIGSGSILEISTILIIVIAAKLVIEGEITLGMMLAISYIIGQLNQPMTGFLYFVQDLQDAKISMERLNEVHSMEEEGSDIDHVPEIDHSMGIRVKNLTFRYPGTQKNVIDNVSLEIPYKGTTAIVGYSGSGKTTLLKLLLKFYNSQEGRIQIGNQNINSIPHQAWRTWTGVVMQEDTLFNDTIAGNIAMGISDIDREKLEDSSKVANIHDFIMELPWGYDTMIGKEGLGLSTGQNQRILLARAVYKNPKYIFLDEATSALDSENEKTIMRNLAKFLKNRTSVIIAHRLSTVRYADNIVVLDNGKVVENGTHDVLISKKGHYFKLIQNQLELGK